MVYLYLHNITVYLYCKYSRSRKLLKEIYTLYVILCLQLPTQIEPLRSKHTSILLRITCLLRLRSEKDLLSCLLSNMIEVFKEMMRPTVVAPRLWVTPHEVSKAYYWDNPTLMQRIDDLLLPELYAIMSEKAWDEIGDSLQDNDKA